uniref:Secreted protein n=1 Tax=Rhabditophanes sp. KR3021 TaxID=114890 RepID=A0AC35U0U2_9BILA
MQFFHRLLILVNLIAIIYSQKGVFLKSLSKRRYDGCGHVNCQTLVCPVKYNRLAWGSRCYNRCCKETATVKPIITTTYKVDRDLTTTTLDTATIPTTTKESPSTSDQLYTTSTKLLTSTDGLDIETTKGMFGTTDLLHTTTKDMMGTTDHLYTTTNEISDTTEGSGMDY